jgi:hypothetical protein
MLWRNPAGRAELAEGLDLVKRVLARQELLKRLDAPEVSDISTPV